MTGRVLPERGGGVLSVGCGHFTFREFTLRTVVVISLHIDNLLSKIFSHLLTHMSFHSCAFLFPYEINTIDICVK